jgi:YbgC/YbaW family acyl-CoA thioester hydrolase
LRKLAAAFGRSFERAFLDLGGERMPTTLTVQIAWGDCDEQGIVYYPNYFYWMDSAFQALLRKAGLSLRIIREKFGAIGIPLVEAKARFHASATHEDALAIEAEVSHWGRTSFQVSYRAFASEIVFEGVEARVWTVKNSESSIAPAPIPAEFRSALTAASSSA